MAFHIKTYVSKEARHLLLDRKHWILSVNNGFAYKDMCFKASSYKDMCFIIIYRLYRKHSILSVNNGFGNRYICVKRISSFTSCMGSIEYSLRIMAFHIKTYLSKEGGHLPNLQEALYPVCE